MNRLRTALLLVCGFLWIPVFAEDTGPTGTPAGGSGQDATGAAPAATSVAEAPAAPVVMPGSYGSAPISLTPGSGRFAKDPYNFTLNLAQGYDSNIFTTHSNQVGSPTTTGALGFQMQSAAPRTIFTLDATLGSTYYWHRPGESAEDYNDHLALVYFHRISSRMSVSANFGIGYYSQPNFSAINATVNQQSGNYWMGDGRLNLSYQWSAKFQTSTSYSLNSTMYEKTQTNNIIENTFGNELHYLLTPRISLVSEVRYTVSAYPQTPTGDSNTIYGLMGGDYAFSNRLRATLRGGVQYREYTNMVMSPATVDPYTLLKVYHKHYISTTSGNNQSSPYLETTLSYIYGNQSTLQWTNRFGLDSSNTASQKVTSFRTGVNMNHVLTAKITITLGLNYNVAKTQTDDKSEETWQIGVPPLVDIISTPTTTQDQFNSVLGIQFRVTPKLSLGANYTFTDIISQTQSGSYVRSQISLGGTYTF